MTLTGREGGCTCRQVRYRIKAEPIIVHCCHCSWCQRETGTAFALNAMIETEHVELLGDTPERVDIPSASGKGQAVLRCPSCKVAVWSHYAGARDRAAFVRVGTLDDPSSAPPDVHIYRADSLPWVRLPDGAEEFAQYYSRSDLVRLRGEDALARLMAVRS